VTDGNDVWGLDVDLAEALAQDMGLTTEFTYFGYDGLYDALFTEQVDVLISALVIVPERMKDFAYTDSYFDAGQVLVVKNGTQIYAPADLNGRSLAVELGAQGHVLATTWQRKVTELDIEAYDSAEEALASLAAGEVDAALVDHVGARLYRGEQSTIFHLYPQVEAAEPYAIVVRAGDEQLLDQLNQTIRRLKSSGELESITVKWLDYGDAGD
jgi:polar amino acid transport system substrate-binding protein